MSDKKNIFMDMPLVDFSSILEFVFKGGGLDVDEINDTLYDEGYIYRFETSDELREDLIEAVLARVK